MPTSTGAIATEASSMLTGFQEGRQALADLFPTWHDEAMEAFASAGPQSYDWRTPSEADLAVVDASLPPVDAGVERAVIENTGNVVVTDRRLDNSALTVWYAEGYSALLGSAPVLHATAVLQDGTVTAMGYAPGQPAVTWSSAANPACSAGPSCLLGSAIMAVAGTVACAPAAALGGFAVTACGTLFWSIGEKMAAGCNDVVRICTYADSGGLLSIQSASCENYYTCGFTATATGTSTLTEVNGYYLYHIDGYIAFELEFIHSGSRTYTQVGQAPSPNGTLRIIKVDARFQGSDPSSRAYKCSTMLSVDATAYYSNGRRPRASYTVNKPSRFSSEAECGRYSPV